MSVPTGYARGLYPHVTLGLRTLNAVGAPTLFCGAGVFLFVLRALFVCCLVTVCAVVCVV